MSPSDASPRRFRGRTVVLAAILAAVAAAGAAALLVNVFERKQEARNPFFRVVDLDERTVDPAIWGKNFPLQYDSYSRTVDQVRTRFGGSEAVPRTPSDADPRSIVSQSRLEEDPRLVTMWAGYAFSHDFREERGHAYMFLDQRYTGRQKVAKQPGTCIHCHASTWTIYNELGGGDPIAGFEKLNRMSYEEAAQHAEHPVACIDCHDPATMQLRVTRPAFMEGIRKVKALQGVEDFDVNRDATRQEMRTYVCGQCHVEYYFRGEEKRLTFPWDKGLRVDDIYAYYAEEGFSDWKHARTGAPVLKAQHPEFETFNQGTHARAGVACADCHMPYERVGALKVSSHHVRSPLLSINRSCQTCHRVPEAELAARAHTLQQRTFDMRNRAMDALVELIGGIEAARAQGIPDERLAEVWEHQRRAQFFTDFVEAENSMGFHAPQEAVRVLGEAIDSARRGQIALHRLGVDLPAPTTIPAAPAGVPAPGEGGTGAPPPARG